MALDFPANPTDQQVYGDYIYDAASTGWRSAVMVGAAPCGSIMPFAGATIPAGWLLCDGSAVSRTTYSSLYAALGGISSPWGQGNGSTTFNLPDLRTRVPVGKNSSGTFSELGAIGGAETMSLQEAHLAAHTHTFSGTTSNTGSHQHAPPVAVVYGGNASTYRSLFATNSGFWSGGDWNNAVTSGGAHDHTYSGTTSSKGSGQAFGLLQPYAVVNYIIKFAAVVAATDTEIAVRMGQAEATVTTQANIVSGYNARLTAVETPQSLMSGQMGSIGTISGAQKVPFDDFWVQRGITYNSTTRRFTVPTAGVYRITFAGFQNSGVQTRVYVGINTDTPGGNTHRGHTFTNSTGYNTLNINSLVSLNANDYIVYYLYEGGLYNGTTDRFNQFSIERIGA